MKAQAESIATNRREPALRSLRASLARVSRVWILNGATVSVAATVYFVWVRHLPAPAASVRIPWWALTAAFGASEICVVHIQLRRDAHSFSLSEVPLVIGLVFVRPSFVVLAQVLGAGLALGIHRRQSPVKLVFNLGHFALEAGLACLVFHAVRGTSAPIAPQAWEGAFAATAIASIIGVLMIFAAITLARGEPGVRQLGRAMTYGLIAAITNSSLGLIGVTVLSTEPSSAWLLGVPTATLFLAYRAYAEERRKHESLGFLYEATRIITQSPRIESGILALLAHAQTVFRAQIADITVISAEGSTTGLRTSVGAGGDVVLMQGVTLDQWPWTELAGKRQAVFLTPPESTDRYGCRLRDVMVAPIMGETRILGTMMIANRLSDITKFDDEDLKLFQTFANHVSVWLENSQLERSLVELTRLKEQLKHQAFHDSLTGLANRELFANRVEHAAARGRGAAPIAVMFLDLDDFKTINDSLGHAAGDQLLRTFAERLGSCLRPGDTAARLGGDEFAILLEGLSGTADAVKVAERVGAAMVRPFEIQDRDVTIGTSIGIAISADRDGAADLLRYADVAMYSAKTRGKHRYEIFQPTMYQATLERMELKEDLQHAIEKGELVLHYQPIVDLETGRIAGLEALARWDHPRRGIIPPDDFIPLAEETGLIQPIGRWVLNESCRQTRLWQARFPRKDPLTVSVNLSGKQIQRDGLAGDVSAALRQSGLAPHSLIVEVTESVLLDHDVAMRRLAELRALGVRVAIDDFGTGYSSLSYLSRFPVDILKVDKSFVREIEHAPDSVLAQAVIELTRTLRLEAVAEGIEQRGQGARLRELGCKFGQGFFYSPPLSADDVSELLAVSPTIELEQPKKRTIVLT